MNKEQVSIEWMNAALNARWLELKLQQYFTVETWPPVVQPVESLTDLAGFVHFFGHDVVQVNVPSWLSQEGLKMSGMLGLDTVRADADTEKRLFDLRRCHVVVPVVSSDLYGSGPAREELEYVAKLGKRIVPVFLEPKKNFEGTWLEPYSEGKTEYRITTSETLDASLTASWRRELEGPLGVWKPALEATLATERERIRANAGARASVMFPRDSVGAVDDARRARTKAWLAQIGVGGEKSGAFLPGDVRTLASSSANVVVSVVQAKASVML